MKSLFAPTGLHAQRHPAISVAALAGFGLLLAACSSAPKAPTNEMARAERSISQAEQHEANRDAAIELAQARDKMQQSGLALRQGNTIYADRYATQARLDAELAQARSELAQANQQLAEIQNSLTILQQEMARPKQGEQQ